MKSYQTDFELCMSLYDFDCGILSASEFASKYLSVSISTKLTYDGKGDKDDRVSDKPRF